MACNQRWVHWAIVAGAALALGGCPGKTELANGEAGQGGGVSGSGGGDAGRGGAGSSGGTAGSGAGCTGSVGPGCFLCGDGSCGTPTCVNGSWTFECAGGGAGSGGTAGTGGGGETCPPNTPVPAICQLCPDGTCGSAVCSGGAFSGFKCAGSADGECVRGGCSGEVCQDANAEPVITDCVFRDEYACYPSAACERQPDGACDWTSTQELTDCLANAGGGGGGLKWYASCGSPVCMADPAPFDDPSIPNCTTEQMGASCASEGARCDGVLSCGATFICAAKDPTAGPGGCPISRARFKQDIDYLSEAELKDYHDQVMSLPLASYHYKHEPNAPEQLGFIIEDVEPSQAVAGDHVNMYGYLSMAVAAIKVQQQQIDALQAELDALRAQRAERGGDAALSCQP